MSSSLVSTKNAFDTFELKAKPTIEQFIVSKDVVSKSKQIEGAYQVCSELTADNKSREVNGLIEAMEFFDLPSGTILTLNQEDYFNISGKEIKVVPVWKWM